MRRVTLASLGGRAYQLEEAAHEIIAGYLEHAARALDANPDRVEIVADLEQAIADKCESFLGKHRNVVLAAEAEQIIREMGPVPGMDSMHGEAHAHDAGLTGIASSAGRRKRLMRVPREGMLGGVCAGIAAYLDIDVVWVRMAFVLLGFATVVWFFVWIVMLFVMPAARTPEQVASVRGETLSARELMDLARRKSMDMGRSAAAGLRDAGENLRDTLRPRG